MFTSHSPEGAPTGAELASHSEPVEELQTPNL